MEGLHTTEPMGWFMTVCLLYVLTVYRQRQTTLPMPTVTIPFPSYLFARSFASLGHFDRRRHGTFPVSLQVSSLISTANCKSHLFHRQSHGIGSTFEGIVYWIKSTYGAASPEFVPPFYIPPCVSLCVLVCMYMPVMFLFTHTTHTPYIYITYTTYTTYTTLLPTHTYAHIHTYPTHTPSSISMRLLSG